MRLEAALKGGDFDQVPEWLNELDDLYRVIKITHWTPEQIDEQPAPLLDQLIAIDNVYRRNGFS